MPAMLLMDMSAFLRMETILTMESMDVFGYGCSCRCGTDGEGG